MTIICFTHSLGDASAERNADESEIDLRVQEVIEMEDPDILVDLRHQNMNGSDKYGVFWTECRSFLDECSAVQERRHGGVCTNMAKAISVHDLVNKCQSCVEMEHRHHQYSGFACSFTPRILEPRQQHSSAKLFQFR